MLEEGETVKMVLEIPQHDAEVEVTIDDLFNGLWQKQEDAATSLHALLVLMNTIYDFLRHVPDDRISTVEDHKRNIIAHALEQEADRWRAKK